MGKFHSRKYKRVKEDFHTTELQVLLLVISKHIDTDTLSVSNSVRVNEMPKIISINWQAMMNIAL